MKQVGVANDAVPCSFKMFNTGKFDVVGNPYPHSNTLTQSNPSILGFARVSSGYNFINSMISKWGDSTVKPPNLYPGCSDKGGFYYDTVLHNCMSFENDLPPPYNCYLGGDTPHAGVTGNMACCACGGGTRVSTPKPTSTPEPTTPKPTVGIRSKAVDPPLKYKVCFYVALEQHH